MDFFFLYGSSAGFWTYGHGEPSLRAVPIWLFVAVTGTAVLWIGEYLLRRKREKSAVLLTSVSAFGLILVLRTLTQYTFKSLIESDMSNSFYSAAVKQPDILRLLGEYNGLLSSLPLHASSNMPGKILLYHTLLGLTASAEVMGYVLVGLWCLTGMVAYGIVRALSDDSRAALYAMILTLFTPCGLYFLPILNAISPLPILAAFFFTITWLRRPSLFRAAAAGALFFLTLIFDPLTFALIPVILAVLAARFQWKKTTPDVFEFVSVAGLTFMFCYFLMRIFTGFDAIDTFFRIFREAGTFNVNSRPYAVWVTQNFFDFFRGAGLPVSLTFAAFLIGTMFKRIRTRFFQSDIVLGAFAFSFLFSLLLLDVLGFNRGETVRLWIFMAIPVQVIAGWFLAKLPSRMFVVIFVLNLLQTALTQSAVQFVVP